MPGQSPLPDVVEKRVHNLNYVANELKALLIRGQATTRTNVDRIHDDHERTFTGDVNAQLGSDESLSVAMQNPDASDTACHFYFGELTHSDTVTMTLHTAIDDAVVLETLDPSNNYIGSTVTPSIDMATVDTFTSSDTHFDQTYHERGTESIFDGYRVTLPPGESLCLEVVNEGGNNDVGARFSWTESDHLTDD